MRMGGASPPLFAVQTEASAPLQRAWARSRQSGRVTRDDMWPWEQVGTSAADGILDDETYDWLPVVAAMADTGGSPVVVTESQVVRAN
jgi:threonine synthase